MGFFEAFSPRARRAIFRANAQALEEGASELTAEHILHGLMKEDPELFALVAPQNPNLVHEIEQNLATGKNVAKAEPRTETLHLSETSKELIRVAAREHKRLGHRAVATQHLLLALLISPEEPKSWFRVGGRQKDRMARQLLTRNGLTVSSVETAIRTGIVTTQAFALNDPILRLNAQLNVLAELLISKGVFTRCEFVELLDKNEGPLAPGVFLSPLIDALLGKGKLTHGEAEMLSTKERPSTPDAKDR